MTTEHNLHRLADGSYIDYGRHWRLFGKCGEGPARHYAGEAGKVLAVILEHITRGIQEGKSDRAF